METPRFFRIGRYMLVFVSACLLLALGSAWTSPNQSINNIIGDRSFIEKYGYAPTALASEQERISTHLEYVERLLRKRDCSHLSLSQQQKRAFLLDKLREYRIAAKFPCNEKYTNERRPCFIDSRGNICAVGYLVEQSAGRALAEAINVKHQCDYIRDMSMPALDAWIQASGLTGEECAMIQPQYLQPVAWGISPEYAVISGVLGGASITFGIINTLQITQSNKPNNLFSILGLASGVATAVNGIIGATPPRFPQDTSIISFYYYYYAPTPERRALSFANIGIGTVTAIISGINLFTTPITENKNVTWGLYTYPTLQAEQLGVGIHISAKL